MNKALACQMLQSHCLAIPICTTRCMALAKSGEPNQAYRACDDCGHSWDVHFQVLDTYTWRCRYASGCECHVTLAPPLGDKPDDPISPQHYQQHPSGVECIQITEHFDFCLGNAIKYIWRHGQKPGVEAIEDLRKARWYLDREIQRLERV